MPDINTTIRQMLTHLVEREGGYVNNSKDRGGPTKYGVTLKTLSAYLRRPATAVDVYNVTKATAVAIFFKMFYTGPNIDLLPPELQPLMTDMAVNHGPSNAVFILQDVLCACGALREDEIDRRLGAKTARAAAELYGKIGEDLINKLVLRRREFYRAIVRNDPTQQAFLEGWLARADSFLVI